MSEKRPSKRSNFVPANEKAKSDVVAHIVQIARRARLSYDDFLYVSQQVRKKLGLRRTKKERRLPQLLPEAELKCFFQAIQDCGDAQHEILLKLLFYTAVRVSELVRIEVIDVDLDRSKIFINQGKGAKDRYILFPVVSGWFSRATYGPVRTIVTYLRRGAAGRSHRGASNKSSKNIASGRE